MPVEVKIPDTEKGEEERVEIPVPDETGVNPQGLIQTKRKTPISVAERLAMRDRMTTQSDRFRES